MSKAIFEVNHKGKKYRIEEDHPGVGAYLYVYEGEKCIKDHLQSDVETCKQMAFENYHVPLDKWILKD